MKTVLVIEDNIDIRENTCELLELEGYKALFAENGTAGLALAREHKPDIILCDILMPEADGYQVFNGLKSNPQTAAIPFIFLTASVERKDIQVGYDMGARGYIKKPFDPRELFDAIEQCFKAE